MPLGAIETLLKQRMGLHSATVGASTVHQAVARRMSDCELQDPGEYLRILQHSATELDALIDTVVIPETWFFRDRNPFTAFSAWLEDEWLPAHADTTLRVLSVPCSTGEEPYTLAMCLVDAGLPADAAQIDAVDISHANIAKARRACYGANSFRGNDLAFRDRHFNNEQGLYRLKDSVGDRVSFARANILDAEFVQQRQPYQIIFCRNLLIYFDRPTQNAAIARLEQLLDRDGILFLGHSETSLVLQRPFAPLEYPRCFAFRRSERRPDPPAQPASARAPGGARAKRRAPSPAPETAPVPSPFAGVTPPVSRQPDEHERFLQEAFRLADEGHLDEAAQHCETLLQRHRQEVSAHYLLGLIRQATGNLAEAEQHLRKAVYLAPNHYEGLAHLGVICEQRGDVAGARRFRERAARVHQRNGQREAEA